VGRVLEEVVQSSTSRGLVEARSRGLGLEERLLGTGTPTDVPRRLAENVPAVRLGPVFHQEVHGLPVPVEARQVQGRATGHIALRKVGTREVIGAKSGQVTPHRRAAHPLAYQEALLVKMGAALHQELYHLRAMLSLGDIAQVLALRTRCKLIFHLTLYCTS
jgi:hypothetical protein